MEEKDQTKQSLASAKGNIEIEGMKVPDVDLVKNIVSKYREQLGDEAADSLLYSIVEGTKMLTKEQDKDVRKKQ